jgi:hypothetical protein
MLRVPQNCSPHGFYLPWLGTQEHWVVPAERWRKAFRHFSMGRAVRIRLVVACEPEHPQQYPRAGDVPGPDCITLCLPF